MGKTIETTELKLRISRYLYKGRTDVLDLDEHEIPTVEKQPLPTDLIYFAATAEEGAFEECIARLYENKKYNRRTRFLGRRWLILDWWYGPLEQRLYRHQFHNYDGRSADARIDYRKYLRKDYLYKKQGQLQPVRHSRYNERRLEEMLPANEWKRLQQWKNGKDHAPPEPYDEIVYQHPPELEGKTMPPLPVMEWLLSLARESTFERNSVG